MICVLQASVDRKALRPVKSVRHHLVPVIDEATARVSNSSRYLYRRGARRSGEKVFDQLVRCRGADARLLRERERFCEDLEGAKNHRISDQLEDRS